MIQEAKNDLYFINGRALSFTENDLGDPNRIAVSLVSGTRIMVYKKGVIDYAPDLEPEKWTLKGYSTLLAKKDLHFIYARLSRLDRTALLVFSVRDYNLDGSVNTITGVDEEGKDIIEVSEPSEEFYYVKIGSVTGTDRDASDPGIATVARNITYDSGILNSSQDIGIKLGEWSSLFVPHYDDPKDPTKLTWIEAKSHMGIQGGVTMYAMDKDVDVPSLASGLPFDKRTIWYNPDTQQIEVIGGTGGGSGEGVSNFWDLSGIPSWITNSKPKYTYSEIEGTPDLTKYALVSQIPSLSGYATESWVKNQGYLTQHQDLSGYQPLITSSNKLAYSLISGTPTSLKNPNALSFGSKSYDGSAKITLTAGDLGALTSHQTIYTLTFASGAFASGSFTANTANKTINIPTTTSHISEGSNLYFTNARAINALAETLKAYVTLGGTQTITGEKNFTGGLKVNGSPIYYDTEKKYWKLEGDLLVTGGVTMYGSDSSFTPSTIMDAIVVDNVTIIKQDGKLVALGGGSSGGDLADAVAWGNILGKPSWITDTTPAISISGTSVSLGGSITQSALRTALGLGSNAYTSTSYLPLSGGTITGRLYYKGIIHEFQTSDGSSNGLMRANSNNLQWHKDSTWHTVIHSGNYSNYALPLSGGTISNINDTLIIKRLSDIGSAYIRYYNNEGALGTIGIGGSQANFPYEPYFQDKDGNAYKIWHSGIDGSGSGLDADLLDGKHADAFALSNTNIKLDSFVNQIGYGFKSQGWYDSGAAMMFGATSNYYMLLQGASDGSKIYLRANYMNNGSYVGWKDIAFTDSNVASATKLQTARTIWGQSFDGTGNVSGNLTLDNSKGIYVKDTSSASLSAFALSSGNDLQIGYDTSANGYNTYLNGKNVYIRYGTSRTIGMILNSSGNLTIGSSDLASTNYKLYVDGNLALYKSAIVWLNDASKYSIQIKDDGQAYYKSYYGHHFYTQDTERMTILSSGNVGIGTTSPTAKLHVSGDVKVTGSSLLGSYVYVNTNDVGIYFGPTSINMHNASNNYSESLIGFSSSSITLYHNTTVQGNILATGGITTNDSVTINGIKLSKSKDGILYLDGNLVVKGGVTMYGTDATSSPSILDSLPIASTSVKGIAQFNPSDFAVKDGVVSFVGSVDGGVASSVSWGNITGKPTFATVATSGKYSDLSGLPTIPTIPSSLKNPYSLTINNSGGTAQVTYDGSAAKTLSLTKAMVGLGNVENTALSTWTGTNKITTLGTITSGTWNGSKIVNAYLANSSVTISGESVSLGGSITQSALRSALGLGSNAYTSTSYLPLSGGTITGRLYYKGIIHEFQTSDGSSNGLMRANSNNLQWHKDSTWHTVIHSGNYSNYALPLSGGTISNINDTLIIKRLSDIGSAYIRYYNNEGALGTIGIGGSQANFPYEPYFQDKDGNAYKIWHSGIDGSGSGLDADLLDGKHADAFALSNTNIKLDSFVNQIGYGFKSQGWYDSGAAMMFGATSNYYMLLQGASDGSKIYLRANYMNNGSYVGWKDIAFTDSNVASATKLQTARTIWGQSFDGTGNVSGNLTLDNSKGIYVKDTSSASLSAFALSSGNDLQIGYDTSANGYNTYLNGKNVYIRYGTSRTIGMILNSSGNLTIGSSDLASTNYKLYVDGNLALYKSAIVWLNDASKYSIQIKDDGQAYYKSYYGHHFYTQDTERMTILSSGNVGIGTTSPTAKLHVSGDVKVTGSSLLGSYVYVNTNDVGIYFGPTSINMHNASNNYSESLIGFSSSSITLYHNTTVQGNILATGAMTFYSMRKLKNVVDERGLSLSELSTIKPTRYTWKDGRDNRLHFGGIADDIQQVLPEVVYTTSDGLLTMDYGNAAFAVASSLIQPVVDHEKRIEMLEAENKELRNEIERLKSA